MENMNQTKAFFITYANLFEVLKRVTNLLPTVWFNGHKKILVQALKLGSWLSFSFFLDPLPFQLETQFASNLKVSMETIWWLGGNICGQWRLKNMMLTVFGLWISSHGAWCLYDELFMNRNSTLANSVLCFSQFSQLFLLQIPFLLRILILL